MSTAWLAVLLVGAGSQGLRMLPLLLAGRLHVPAHLASLLRDAGTAALAALLASAVAGAAGRRDGGQLGLLVLPLVVAAGLALRGCSLARVMLAAAASYAIALALTSLF